MSGEVKRKIIFGYFTAFFLFTGLAFYSYITNKNSFKSSLMIARSHEVLFNIEKILTCVIDQESGQRGYLITGNKIFLAPVKNTTTKLNHHLLTLRWMVSDNKEQLANLDTMELFVKKKVAFINHGIALLNQGEQQKVASIIATLEGKNYMDQIKRFNLKMGHAENELLKQRLLEAEAAYDRFNVFFAALVLAILSVLSILFLIIDKNNKKLNRASSEIDELYNTAPCGYFTLDGFGKILNVNLTNLNWLRLSKNEVLGKNVTQILSAKDDYTSELHRSMLQAQGWVLGLEYNLLGKDGLSIPVIINSIAVNDKKGKMVQVRTTVFDHREGELKKNEILQLNNELKRNVASLETANKELESFTYSVSHDLRAPLRSIIGYAHILEEENHQTLDQESKRVLQIICNNARRMGQLIDDLLSFSHIGKKDLVKRWANMKEIAEQAMIEQLEVSPYKERVIEIAEMGEAFIDVGLIKQVWTNLISNAIKYSGNQEKIIIRIGKKIENGLDVFYVEDNGVGFDMFYVHKLFGVFQRLHKQKEFEGTGVGLAIVYRIIQKHGGKIWAHSEIGRGACFYFTISHAPTYAK